MEQNRLPTQAPSSISSHPSTFHYSSRRSDQCQQRLIPLKTWCQASLHSHSRAKLAADRLERGTYGQVAFLMYMYLYLYRSLSPPSTYLDYVAISGDARETPLKQTAKLSSVDNSNAVLVDDPYPTICRRSGVNLLIDVDITRLDRLHHSLNPRLDLGCISSSCYADTPPLNRLASYHRATRTLGTLRSSSDRPNLSRSLAHRGHES